MDNVWRLTLAVVGLILAPLHAGCITITDSGTCNDAWHANAVAVANTITCHNNAAPNGPDGPTC